MQLLQARTVTTAPATWLWVIIVAAIIVAAVWLWAAAGNRNRIGGDNAGRDQDRNEGGQ